MAVLRRCGVALALIALACSPLDSERGAGAISPELEGGAGAPAWEFRNAESWEIADGELRLVVAGEPSGPIRKPGEWAILRGEPLGSFVVEADVRADAPVSRMGRDVLIYFGYQSPTRFYYAHFSNETTPPHNGIFLVHDADRLRIDDASAEPRLMDGDWHRVRLERDVESGEIRVYLGDMNTPLLQAVDTTLRAGRVGFGSFDDPAAFREITITPQ